MSASMVQKVAYAISTEVIGELDAIYLAAARAAIEAMREPTEVMTGAARDARIYVDQFPIYEGEAEEVWKVMIAAALSEASPNRPK